MHENPTYTHIVSVAKRGSTGKIPAESTSFVGRRQLLAESQGGIR